jgi:hypothetical protein
MSQWIGAARTNFFQVIDEAKFREWAAERELSVETKATGSTTLFGIYSETDDGGWPTQTWPDSEITRSRLTWLPNWPRILSKDRSPS